MAVLAQSQERSTSERSIRFLRKWLPAYGMIIPFFILFAIFTVWPIFYSFFLSFTQYAGTKAPVYIGLQNYRELFADTRLHTAMWNITRFVFFTVSINTIVGLILALIFSSQGRLNQIARTLFFMPAVTSGIATLTIWQYIFRTDKNGLLNQAIQLLGGKPIPFLARPSNFMSIFVFLGIWGSCGMTMIFFMAGLRSINKEYYEAAAIDGASSWRRFWSITLPLLRPTLLYVITTGIIGTFQLFDMAYILGGGGSGLMGGPLDAALSPLLYLYYLAFQRLLLGKASALAYMLFMVIIFFSLIALRVGRFREDIGS